MIWKKKHFFSLTCNNYCKPKLYNFDNCGAECTFVSEQSCFEQIDISFWTKVEERFKAIKPILKDPFPLFFYHETPCCQAIHQVVALIIVKSLDEENVQEDLFKFYYFDSSGKEKLPISNLRSVIVKVFGDYPIKVMPCQQQSFGMLDDLGGILVLANVKLFIDSYSSLNKSESVVAEKTNIITNSFDYFKLRRNLKPILIKSVVNDFLVRFWWNLYLLGSLFAKARESAIANYQERGGSIETREFISLKESLIREEKRFQDIFEITHQAYCNLKEIKEFTENADPTLLPDIFDLYQGLRQAFSYFNLGSSTAFSNLSRKVFALENLSVNYERRNFSIVEKFLISDSSIKPLNLNSCFIFLKKLMMDNLLWNPSNSPIIGLFNLDFSSDEMLTSTEKKTLARLLCGLSLKKENLKFVDLGCCSSNKGLCSRHHLNNRRSWDSDNRFVIGSKDCFTSAEITFDEQIIKCLNEYRDSHSKTKPLIIWGGCTTVCCQAIHQSWALVIYLNDLDIYQIWYYNPSDKKTNVLPFLENILREVLGSNFSLFPVVNSLQTDGDLDFKRNSFYLWS